MRKLKDYIDYEVREVDPNNFYGKNTILILLLVQDRILGRAICTKYFETKAVKVHEIFIGEMAPYFSLNGNDIYYFVRQFIEKGGLGIQLDVY